MSNIIKTLNFLRESPTDRFITITEVETNQPVGLKNIYIADIPNSDLESYIKTNLGNRNEDVLVLIECRKIKGASSVKVGTFSALIKSGNAPQNTLPMNQQIAPQPTQPTPQPQPNYDMLNGATGQGMLAVPLLKVMEDQNKINRLEILQEKIDDLKEDKAELKKKLQRERTKYDQIDIEIRQLKSELSIANAQKDMAVMMAKSENKSFLENIPFEKLLDKAPQILGQMAAMKSGVPVAESLNAPGVSEEQQRFIEFMDSLNDEQIDLIGKTSRHINNQAFIQELAQLNSKYDGK